VLDEPNPEFDAIYYQQLHDLLDERAAKQEAARLEARRLRRDYDEVARTNESPRQLFQAGYRFLQGEEWEAADEALRKVIDAHPDSRWSLEARLCLFDMAFEIDCDPAGVAELIDFTDLPAAIAAAEQADDFEAPVIPQQSPPIPTLELPIHVPGPEYAFDAEFRIAERPWAEIHRDALLRRGLWTLLQGDIDSAKELHTEALRINGIVSGPVGSVSRLVYVASPFWMSWSEAGESDPAVGLLMQYSDLLFNAQMPNRSHRMFDRLLNDSSLPITDAQRSYLHFQRAMSRASMYGVLERLPVPIVEDYLQSQALAPQSRWAAEALLRAGLTEWTLDYVDPVALEYFQRVIDEYPDTWCAPQAALNMGLFYEEHEQWEDAFRAYLLIVNRYEDSNAYDSANEHITEIRPHLPDSLLIEIPEPATP
jgi:TolA-binding protein